MGFDQFTFGKRFKELRKERKLTQEQLADRLGISDRHVRGIEHGDFFLPLICTSSLHRCFRFPWMC